MRVVLLQISTMGGTEYHNTAYIDIVTARLVADALTEEWKSYHPKVLSAERIPDGFRDRTHCAVGNTLYILDETSADETHRICGLTKLTPDERLALGLLDD